MPERKTGEVSVRVAANIRKFRTQAGLTTYQVADRLHDIGWEIQQSQVTKTERGQRVVSVDDLIAFALVLNVSPSSLLFEGEFDAKSKPRPVLGLVKATPVETWEWATGEQPLRSNSGTVSAARFRLEAAPHRAVSGE